MNSKKLFNTKNMTLISLMTALMCVLAPLSIPLPFTPVPISLGVLIVYFCSYVLEPSLSVISILLYILLGLVGVPVFSKFSSGPGMLFGPTGGYIISYIIMVFICSYSFRKFPDSKLIHVAAMLAALLVCYLLGTLWFVFKKEGIDFIKALSLCVIPFVPADIVKIAISSLAGPEVVKRLRSLKFA